MKLHVKKHALACALAVLLSGPAFAASVTSAATDTVTGHAPTLTAGELVSVDNNSNNVLDTGDTVKVNPAKQFTLSDPDSDPADATTPGNI